MTDRPNEDCPYAQSEITPCYHSDGDSALDEDGCCVGCGRLMRRDSCSVETQYDKKIRYRRRAIEAEEKLAELECELEEQKLLLTISRRHFLRIFDEKVARCERIAELESENANLRKSIADYEPWDKLREERDELKIDVEETHKLTAELTADYIVECKELRAKLAGYDNRESQHECNNCKKESEAEDE